MNTRLAMIVAALTVIPASAAAQHRHAEHGEGASMQAAGAVPVLAGQSAYAALAEIVRILEADPATDWSRVDLERVRRHLIDMHEVVVNAEVAQREVEAGFEADVTGTGRTIAAIVRMARAHAAQVESERPYRVAVAPLENGARVRVTVSGSDPAEVRKLRALGFVGLLTLGDHHGPHHLLMARGGGH